HTRAAVAEIFGDCRCEPRPVQAHQRRMIRGRGDDHGPRAVLRTQDALDEFLHFAAALADQPHDDHIRAGVAGHHAEKHALADAAAGEESHALPAAYGEERVDRADPDVERLADRMPQQRVDRTTRQAYGRAAGKGTETIERLCIAVDDAAEELGANADGARALARDDASVGSKPMRVS